MDILLIEAEKFVYSFLTKELDNAFLYHNISHTQRVVKYSKELIKGEGISEADGNTLLLAAWFHDVGYTNGSENHEEYGVNIAAKFLKEHKVDSKIIKDVSQLILATKMGYEPKTILEKIIRDADCGHFASKNYNDIGDLLREEWRALGTKTLDDVEWIEENISFFTKQHHYYSNYAQEIWQKGKDKNLASFFKALKKQKQELIKEEAKKEQLTIRKNKAVLPERGVETMFRVTLKNHITLSDIADTKANILLSVNAIIVSLVLSNLIPKLDNPSNHHLIYPTIIFVLFTIASMILSVLATRPNVTSGKFSKEDVKAKKVNLLFFGNFHKMSLQDFEWAMGEMMKDRDYLYSSMKKDLYFLGKVLNRKYNILRTTYTVFMIGIIVSLIAFSIAFQYA